MAKGIDTKIILPTIVLAIDGALVSKNLIILVNLVYDLVLPSALRRENCFT